MKMVFNYLLLTTFSFRNLQREIQQMIQKPRHPKIKEICENNCYLAQDPEGEEYGRVIVRGIHDDMVDCFFVDFGDSTQVSKNDLKFLPDDVISKLPFQVRVHYLFMHKTYNNNCRQLSALYSEYDPF